MFRKFLMCLGVVVAVVFSGCLFPGFQNSPELHSVEVSGVNDTHERVSWTTDRPTNSSLVKLVSVEGGGWFAVESVDSDVDFNHSVVTDIHSTRDLEHAGRSFDTGEVTG